MRAIDGGELGLTPEGRRALAAVGGGAARPFRPGDGERLVKGRAFRSLLDQGFFDFQDGQEALVRRYVELQDRSDTRTAGVFVRPLQRR